MACCEPKLLAHVWLSESNPRTNGEQTMTHENDYDLGDDLEIMKASRRASGGGTWVCGTLQGHCFDALVFPEHAEVADYELGDSRISKLLVQRLADKATTFNWDRGMDQPAADDITQAIVDFLAAGLADHTYAD
jgi:hypothetical protein